MDGQIGDCACAGQPSMSTSLALKAVSLYDWYLRQKPYYAASAVWQCRASFPVASSNINYKYSV